MNKNLTFSKTQYLAFIKFLGYTSDGKRQLQIYLTDDTESVWGNNWNYTPSGSMAKVEPEIATISYIITVELDSVEEYGFAYKNTCFSMQDCIDGIIPLMFTELPTEKPLILRFGEEFNDELWKMLEENGFTYISHTKNNKEEEIVNAALDKLDNDENGEDNGDETDW